MIINHHLKTHTTMKKQYTTPSITIDCQVQSAILLQTSTLTIGEPTDDFDIKYKDDTWGDLW